jgi:hypothetical protein
MHKRHVKFQYRFPLSQMTGCGDMANMKAVESPNQDEFLTQDLLAYTKL